MTVMIQLGSQEKNFYYSYKSGEWNIVLQKQADETHYRFVSDEDRTARFVTEYHGDLNRCIAATPKYHGEYSVEQYRAIRNAFVNALKTFAIFKGVPFKDKFQITVDSPSMDGVSHTVCTNKKQHGIKVDFSYTSDHKLSTTGVVVEERTLGNFYQAAEYLLSVEVGEYAHRHDSENGYDLANFIDTVAKAVHDSFSNVLPVAS